MRHALRVLIQNPGVTVVAIFSLALGIGANTAIFSILEALILRPLPIPHPQQLVALSTSIADDPNGNEPFTLPMFNEIAKRQHVFSGMFGWLGGLMDNFEVNGVRFATGLDEVTGDYFSTLGITPLLGRAITPADVALDTGVSSAVAVISYQFWQRRCQGDPAVLGKTIYIEGKPYSVIGVLPKHFAGLLIDGPAEMVTVPIGSFGSTQFRNPLAVWLPIVARLKHGVTLAQARAQIETLWPHVLDATLPPQYSGARRARFFSRRIDIKSAATGNSFLRDRFSRPFSLLMAVVGAVLLIACLNLANLLLARAARRQREMGIRVALGATGRQLTRQLLTESGILAFAGASLGLLVAFWTSHLLVRTMWTGYTSTAFDPSLDWRVLAFTAILALLTALVFGLAPAWHVVHTHPAAALQRMSRSVRAGTGVFGKSLVTAQVALSLVLVIGAALFVRSLHKLRSADLGFRREGLLVFALFPQIGHEKVPDRAAYYHDLIDNLSQLPRVEAVSYSNLGPANRLEFKESVSLPSSPAPPVQAVEDTVGPGFFRLMGMPVLSGREFDWRDAESAAGDASKAVPRVTILSESLAKRLFPNQDPIGRRIDVGPRPEHKGLQIIGVVTSASLWKAQSRNPMAVYLPFLQESANDTPLVDIRTSGDPARLKAAAERIVDSLGHHYPLRMQTLEERQDVFFSEERLTAALSTFFGVLALLLASVGLYGVMSYAVTQRTAEIGVRMAVGAQTGNVVALVLKEVMWLTLGGVVAGLAAAWAVSRILAGMLFGVSPGDPPTLLFAVAVLLAVALSAAYWPAYRASHVDPTLALRAE